MPDENRKPQSPEIDPATIEKLLEIELMQKRASWQQGKARRGTYRALAFLFLFLVIFGAAFAFYHLRSQRAGNGPDSRALSATPTATP